MVVGRPERVVGGCWLLVALADCNEGAKALGLALKENQSLATLILYNNESLPTPL